MIPPPKTSLPRHLRTADPAPSRRNRDIKNRKLRTLLNRQDANATRTKAYIKDAQFLTSALGTDAGAIQLENDLERTWRLTQAEIASSTGQEGSKGRKEWVLDGGPYKSRYTRNGRHLAIAGKMGHVASFDWQTGTIHTELQLREACRDITFLHDQTHFAVAQAKYVFMYDTNGVELHKMKSHIEPTRLEYLPYHWLLVSTGMPGRLIYQDVSTGQFVASHSSKSGSCLTMAQNPHNAVIYLGHNNGAVTLWTPNLHQPAVRVLAHLGPVQSISVDPSSRSCGRYMATSGRDGQVKVWDCRNWKGAVREWTSRGGSAELDWSAKGHLAVGSGGTVNIHMSPAIHQQFKPNVLPPLFMTHPIPSRPLTSLRFCPHQDILTVGHAKGLSNLLIPGSGEPHLDSSESDPFETKKIRREREVRQLLDKLQPDMIALDPEFIGNVAGTTRVDADAHADDESGPSDDEQGPHDREEQLKSRVKGKSTKRYLQRKREEKLSSAKKRLREKIESAKVHTEKPDTDISEGWSALDRFKT